MQWRKWNRIIHRDLGYFIVGLTIIYSLSGIAVNHRNDWNPSFDIEKKEAVVKLPENVRSIKKEGVIKILEQCKLEGYKKHYFPSDSTLRVFIKDGSVSINTNTENTVIEKLNRRPIFHQINFLHYNVGRWWIYFADFFAGALIIVAVTGLFVIKGKKGITGRGAWFTIAGLLMPIIYLLIFYK